MVYGPRLKIKVYFKEVPSKKLQMHQGFDPKGSSNLLLISSSDVLPAGWWSWRHVRPVPTRRECPTSIYWKSLRTTSCFPDAPGSWNRALWRTPHSASGLWTFICHRLVLFPSGRRGGCCPEGMCGHSLCPVFFLWSLFLFKSISSF